MDSTCLSKKVLPKVILCICKTKPHDCKHEILGWIMLALGLQMEKDLFQWEICKVDELISTIGHKAHVMSREDNMCWRGEKIEPYSVKSFVSKASNRFITESLMIT